jgi:hypothetical protein
MTGEHTDFQVALGDGEGHVSNTSGTFSLMSLE